jgi:hypothetical protein
VSGALQASSFVPSDGFRVGSDNHRTCKAECGSCFFFVSNPFQKRVTVLQLWETQGVKQAETAPPDFVALAACFS